MVNQHRSRGIQWQPKGFAPPQECILGAPGRQVREPDLPDVDLFLRTSGEQRISNFMLWQGSYAEYSFPQCNWPDFDRAALLQVLQDYANRDRRFGARKETQP